MNSDKLCPIILPIAPVKGSLNCFRLGCEEYSGGLWHKRPHISIIVLFFLNGMSIQSRF